MLFFALRKMVGNTGDESAFSYNEGNGNGPKEWGKLKADWKSCEEGKYQSPINIVEEDVQVLPKLGKLRRDYNPAPAIVKNRGHDILVIFVSSFIIFFVSYISSNTCSFTLICLYVCE